MRSIALALLLLAAPDGLAAPPEARARKEEGDRLRQAGDSGGATRAYRAALELDGGYAEAHEALGETLYAAKETARAIESFGYAVEIDPGYALAWYNLAFAARKSGDHRRARDAYRHYVRLRPADADGHFGLAESARALGDRDEAVAQYQLFVDLARSDPAQVSWVEKAIAAQAELKAGAPSATAAPVALAAVVAPGAAAAPQASPTPPAGPAAVSLPAPSGAAAGAAVGAALAVAPVVVAPPAAAPVVARAPAAPTRALYEKLGSGDRAFLAGDLRTALFAYQDAVYLEPASAVARIRLARAYAALGHKDQASQQLKQALELDPGNGEARKLADELANPPAAAPIAAPPAAVPPASPAQAAPTSPKLYRLTDEAGAPPPGAPPGPPLPADREAASRRYRSALAMIAERDFNGAIAELDQAILASPQLGVAHAARASAYHGLGRYLEAVRDYQAALKLAPELAMPLYGLAESCRQLKDPRAGEFFARYAESQASDVRPELRETAKIRAAELGAR